MDSSERILDLLEEVAQLRELLAQKDKQIALLERISKTQEETIASLKESIAIEAERIKNLNEWLEKSLSLTDRATEQANGAIKIAESLAKH